MSATMHREPHVDPRAARLELPIVVDGRAVLAVVTGEALRMSLGASDDPRSWLHAYRTHAGRVNRAAIRKSRHVAGQPVVLTAADL